MKSIRGWKRISHKGGFVNETTGQTLVIAKQEFAEHYHFYFSNKSEPMMPKATKYLQNTPAKLKPRSLQSSGWKRTQAAQQCKMSGFHWVFHRLNEQ